MHFSWYQASSATLGWCDRKAGMLFMQKNAVRWLLVAIRYEEASQMVFVQLCTFTWCWSGIHFVMFLSTEINLNIWKTKLCVRGVKNINSCSKRGSIITESNQSEGSMPPTNQSFCPWCFPAEWTWLHGCTPRNSPAQASHSRSDEPDTHASDAEKITSDSKYRQGLQNLVQAVWAIFNHWTGLWDGIVASYSSDFQQHTERFWQFWLVGMNKQFYCADNQLEI